MKLNSHDFQSFFSVTILTNLRRFYQEMTHLGTLGSSRQTKLELTALLFYQILLDLQAVEPSW